MNEVTPCYSIEFPVVSDLHDNNIKTVTPTLFIGDGPSHRSSWPVDGTNAAVSEFFRMAQFVRSRENGKIDFATLSEAERETIAERQRQPFEFEFDVSFWNSEHTEQWTRRETLVYEPLTNTAFVRHKGQPKAVVTDQLAQDRIMALERAARPRDISPEQRLQITQIVRRGLEELRASSPASWAEEDPEMRVAVKVTAIENDRETLSYRADIQRALEAGGLIVVPAGYIGVVGNEFNEQFVGFVTVSPARSGDDLIQPFIVAALQAANVPFRVSDDEPRCAADDVDYNHRLNLGVSARLIVGQRG